MTTVSSDPSTFKICKHPDCRMRKPIADFHKKGQRFDSLCKSCRSREKKAAYEKKRQLLKQIMPANHDESASKQQTDSVSEEKEKPNEDALFMDSLWCEAYGKTLSAIELHDIQRNCIDLLLTLKEIRT